MKTQYTIVTAGSSKELIEKVQSKLNEGWTLQGGVSITLATSPTLVQAMVKKS